jgi:hypothetical protein
MASVQVQSRPSVTKATVRQSHNPFAFPDPTGLWWGWSKSGHAALDVLGLAPAFGEAADGINGLWYLAEGNHVDAGLSFASMSSESWLKGPRSPFRL